MNRLQATLAILAVACVLSLFYASKHFWLQQRVAEDEAFVHTLRMRLATSRAALGNCTEFLDRELLDVARAQHDDSAAKSPVVPTVAVQREFVDTCVAQAHELGKTIETLQQKLNEQTHLVTEMDAELGRLRAALRAARDATSPPTPPPTHVYATIAPPPVVHNSTCEQQLLLVSRQRTLLADQLAARVNDTAASLHDCVRASAPTASPAHNETHTIDAQALRSERARLVAECNAEMAVVTQNLTQLRRMAEQTLDTGLLPYDDDALDELVRKHSRDGTIYITALKYEPMWLLNWWHLLRDSRVESALVFACSQHLVDFCHAHDIPVYAAWPMVADYPLCDRVDRGSGVKLRALLAVLKRGVAVVYSDADVVWRKPFVPPRTPRPYDIALQSYSPFNGSDVDALVAYGTNFGLFHARPTTRLIALLERWLPRAAAYFDLVTAPHWRTVDGLDQFRVYGCNDQNALHELLDYADENGALCGYSYDGGALPPLASANDDECVRVALLSPQRYPVAMPYIYSGRHDAQPAGVVAKTAASAVAADALVALHMTTYPGSDKLFGARELLVWTQDDDGYFRGSFFAFAQLASQRPPKEADFDRDVLRPLVRLFSMAGALDRIAVLPLLPCRAHPLFSDVPASHAHPYVIARDWCTVDLFFDVAVLAKHFALREHSFVKHRRAAHLTRQTVTLRENLAAKAHVGEALSKNDIKHAFRDVKQIDVVLWRDFDFDIELNDLGGALKHARRAVLQALQLNAFYTWDERIRSFFE